MEGEETAVCRLTSTASVVAKWKGSLQTGRRAHESVQARERHVRGRGGGE